LSDKISIHSAFKGVRLSSLNKGNLLTYLLTYLLYVYAKNHDLDEKNRQRAL